jgi:aspartyl-tRNA(Asn)/glutamyl-tRNA(Gln) amidotransferase subunit C
MKISKDEVLHVAHLARLELDEVGIDKLAVQIGKIFEYVDSLTQVDTTGVAPTSHANFLSNAFREDKLHRHLTNEAALVNAPKKDEGTFLVPKVIE